MLLEKQERPDPGSSEQTERRVAIAESAAREGARLIFNYQNDRFKDKVEKLAEGLEGRRPSVRRRKRRRDRRDDEGR